jgi:CubicO group peptidase (beta-lactamase class C family)
MKTATILTTALLLTATSLQAPAYPPYAEHGSVGDASSSSSSTSSAGAGSEQTIEEAIEENTPAGAESPFDAHPDGINTSVCNFHGTRSPTSSTYAAFETSLVGPRGNGGRSIQNQVEYHQVGGASIVIIEGGAIAEHHWYGCADRAAAQRTTSSTIYQAASLSKFVSAIGLVKADRLGVVDLNRNMRSYATEYPDSLLAEWVDAKFHGSYAGNPHDITLRRLLNHTAGLDTHGINSWAPGHVPTLRDILMGSNHFGGSFVGGVEPIAFPKTRYEYSGGGYIVAEHVLELNSPVSFKDYLQQQVLYPAGMSLSTFDKAQASMSNLARPFSRSIANSTILQSNVKAAGGLLANAREYAELVTALVNGGYTASGHQMMVQSDIDTILTPVASSGSSFDPCYEPGATRRIDQGQTTIRDTGIVIDVPPVIETCVAGKFRELMPDGDDWYGLGVSLSTHVEADGYPRMVEHGGAQTGSRSYFKIDRRTGDGVVVMINGDEEWIDGDGYTFGSAVLLDEIKAAYNATY